MKFFAILERWPNHSKRVNFEADDNVAATKQLATNYPDWHVNCFWPVRQPKPQEHIPLPNSFTHPLPQFNPNFPTYPLTV